MQKIKDGNYPISGKCGGFVSCSEGLAYHMKCQPDTAFNRVKKVCDYAQVSKGEVNGSEKERNNRLNTR